MTFLYADLFVIKSYYYCLIHNTVALSRALSRLSPV